MLMSFCSTRKCLFLGFPGNYEENYYLRRTVTFSLDRKVYKLLCIKQGLAIFRFGLLWMYTYFSCTRLVISKEHI